MGIQESMGKLPQKQVDQIMILSGETIWIIVLLIIIWKHMIL